MARESLTACLTGIEKAKEALTAKRWSHKDLAKIIDTTRQPVGNFFQGRGVDRKNFVAICEKLGLNWKEIAGLASSPDAVVLPNEPNLCVDIDALVQDIREKVRPYIQEHCGTMKVLNTTQPIQLGDIYTSVYILKNITGCRGSETAKLLRNYNLEESDHFGLGHVAEERIEGLEAVNLYSKLMILGKPGAGKTTFLKHLALHYINSNREFEKGLVPFFITLKEFADFSNQLELPEFIVQHLDDDAITNTQVIQLLKSGKFLLLLDGLDAVKEEDSSRVINHIKEFSERYRTNRFIITCRIAALEDKFEKFNVVEVADFDKTQIQTFVTKWFHNQEPEVSKIFIEQLESNNRIKELAIHPLLLALLCLEFEEPKTFPSDRTDLYRRAINTLLKKGDSSGTVDEVHKKLSVGHKKDLLAGFAWSTFVSGDYLFHQIDIERYIKDYICKKIGAKTSYNALRIDSEAILKSIEAHYGLLVERATSFYSFSHLTFHEYFTSINIVDSSKPENLLKILVSHISEKRWREVFLLTAGLLNPADTLLQLMKQEIDALLIGDKLLQRFLTWVKQKSESVEVAYQAATIRALYLSQTLKLDLFLELPIDPSFDLKLDYELFRTLDLLQTHYLSFANRSQSRSDYFDLFLSLGLKLDRELSQILDLSRTLDQDGELQCSLQELKSQLPHNEVNIQGDTLYWQQNGQAWAERLRGLMIEHRDIGHHWQFKESQRELLRQYYDANKLLVDCLNSSRYVNPEVRQQIEGTLLLPEMKEI